MSAPDSTACPERLLEEIRRCCTRPWTLMEVCGGQTHALLRHGIDQLLPPGLTLIHGPGCPVCVTASERIDQALELAAQPEVILCSFGDMLRVPGSQGSSLLDRRAAGADVRVVYSPLDVLELARRQPERRVVFFAVGFETTAPATALLAQRALAEGLTNLSLLVSHVLVPPVLEVMLSNPACRVEGVLAAGHVCTVMGEQAYGQLVERHRRPIVVTGFEAHELLLGILHCVRLLERGEQRLENVYRRAVRQRGNGSARALIEAVFQPEDAPWRGLGTIPLGGLRLRPPYDALAVGHSSMTAPPTAGPHACLSGQVLQGLLKPPDCPSFNRTCTPATPLGAPMVSSEGACAAYHRYRTLA